MTLYPVRLDLPSVLGALAGLLGIPRACPRDPPPATGVPLNNRERPTQPLRYLPEAALRWRGFAVQNQAGE